jgi:hypothetical protein
MEKEEMDKYLESIGGLVSSYRPEMGPIMSSKFFACDTGWFPLIKELIDDLIKLGWNKEISQVKEKFGGLRFYISEGSDEIFDRIVKAERDSYEICEVTGKPGKLRKDIGWFLTLCDEEYEKRLKRNKERDIG